MDYRSSNACHRTGSTLAISPSQRGAEVQGKPLLVVTLCCAILGGVTPTVAESSPPGRNKHHAVRAYEQPPVVVFSPRDVRLIRAYYGPRYRGLPPGLQKKLRRTGSLPPGWQKKLQPFPVVLERQLVVLPYGYRRVVIDGNAVLFDPRTRAIVDVTMLD